ncbi:MAG: hypothetical protein H7123_09120, partial [Thermoleophilia bacterium]|nr:hypothetical protein [Thermoleophilia bacterium]
YEVEYGGDPSFQNSGAISQGTTEQTSFLAPVTSGTLYWRVRAVVGSNHGIWSAVDDSGPVVVVNPPVSIQFEVSRQNVPAGQVAFFDGYLSGNGMVNLNGKTIELQRKDTTCGEAGTYTTFASQDTGSTGSEGTVRIGATADRNRCFRFAWNRGDQIFYSAPMAATVNPTLKLTSAKIKVRRATNFNMTVSSTSLLTGRVRAQYRIKGVWTNIKTMTFSSRKSYTFAAQINKAGSFPTRVIADGLVTSSGYRAFEDTTANGPSVRVLDLFKLYGKSSPSTKHSTKKKQH